MHLGIKGMRAPSRGGVLIESVFTALVWACLAATAHWCVLKFWKARLEGLDRTRLVYDGVKP